MAVGSIFRKTALKIINDSIRSAVCVDDSFVEPYGLKQKGDIEDIPKSLYESFKAENCNLCIYKYVDPESWLKNKEFVLKSRDLLILDWLLIGEPAYKESLNILGEAVRIPGKGLKPDQSIQVRRSPRYYHGRQLAVQLEIF